MKTIARRSLRTDLLAPAALVLPLALLTATLVPALGGTSHAAAPPAAMQGIRSITIKASAAHLPARIPAGMVALTVVNDTRTPANVDLGRANPGATQAAIAAANAAANTPQGFIGLTHLLTFLGGPDSVPPGGQETAILDLRVPGSYGLHLDSGQWAGP